MDKKVCKCGHSDSIHEYYTDTCHAKGCSCLSFQEPNPNPPSPEMVCPDCKGVGHWLLASMGTAKVCPKCHGSKEVPDCGYDAAPSDVIKCPKCNGTGKVPPPEPPEKVRDLLLTEKEIDSAFRSYPQLKPCGTTLYCCIMDILRAKILKLQQAGWVDGSKTYCVYCGTEFKVDDAAGTKVTEHIKTCTKHPLYQALARIKELEKQNEQLRIGELVITTEQKQKEQIIAEARQQALKELKDYVCNECSTPNFVNVVIPKRIWDDWQK